MARKCNCVAYVDKKIAKFLDVTRPILDQSNLVVRFTQAYFRGKYPNDWGLITSGFSVYGRGQESEGANIRDASTVVGGA